MKKNLFSIIFLTIFLTAICFNYGCSSIEGEAYVSSPPATVSQGVFLSTGTDTESQQQQMLPIEVQQPLEPVSTATPTPLATAGDEQQAKYKTNKIEITYKDPGTEETYTKTAELSSENDMEAALNAVNELFLSDTFGDIKVNKVVQNEGNIFIDFTESVYVLAENPSEEYPALEAIADAYLNNIEGAKGVYFTVNGAGYSSVNMEYGADEPFKTKG